MVWQPETRWPFLCFLAGLLVLSAVAPRAWEKRARNPSADRMLAELAQGNERPEQPLPSGGNQDPFPTLTNSPDLAQAPTADPPGDSADLPMLVEVAERVGSLRVVDLDETASSQDQEAWDLPELPVPDSVEPELLVLREAQRQRGFGLPELRVTEPE